MSEDEGSSRVVELTSQLVSAYVSNNAVPLDEFPKLIARIHHLLVRLDGAEINRDTSPKEPAVDIEQSVKDDHIICLEDGLPFRVLKRHLKDKHGMTPDEYREKWKLPADYPMVAPSTSAIRSDIAKKHDLAGHSPNARAARRKRKKARRE